MDFTDTEVGRAWKVGPIAMDKDKMLAFAREYDPLPFHTDEAYAAGTRHGRLVAPGVMTFMTMWSQFIAEDMWGENMLGGMSTKITWLKPVYAGDALRGELEVSAKRRRNPHNGVVEITSRYFNQDDALVMTNVTEMVIAG
jgi:Acyl dehydratase